MLELKVNESAVQRAFFKHSPLSPYAYRPGPGRRRRMFDAWLRFQFALGLKIVLFAAVNAFMVAFLGSFSPTVITVAGRTLTELLTFFVPVATPTVRLAVACAVAFISTIAVLLPLKLTADQFAF